MASGGNSIFRWSTWVSPELEAFQREFPRKLTRAMVLVVNNVAFGLREDMQASIGELLMVRSPSFVRRHLLVSKARSGSLSPVAEVGSIRRGKFEGWAAQQFGAPVERERVPTLAARGGAQRRVMRSRARLMPGKDIPTAREIVGRSDANAVIALMRILARRGDRRPFLVFPGENPKIPGGLYEMRGRRDRRYYKPQLRMLQALDDSHAQPKRVDWVNHAWTKWQSTRSIAGEWVKAWNLVGWQDVMKRG